MPEHEKAEKAGPYLKQFLRWTMIACVVGVAVGALGSVFCLAINASSAFFLRHDWIIWLLPAGGLAIALLYRAARKENVEGTDKVIGNVRSGRAIPFVMVPLIFVSTVLTRLFGGSVGTEGAAIQLGGSFASNIGRMFRIKDDDRKIIIMCGISAGFASVVGTPMTSIALAIELAGVGIIYYSAFLPCAISAIIGIAMTKPFGLEFARYTLKGIPDLAALPMLQVAALAALCAAVSILFCVALQKTEKAYGRLIKSHEIRAVIGGLVIAGLTFLVGTNAYSGDGMRMLGQAVSGVSQPQDFALKIAFTALAIGAGFKGGEIVPSWAVGAAFGNVAGGMLGLSPSFGAGIGLVSVFCGVINCPFTAFVLGVELFGGSAAIFFILACALCYVLSGYFGLYPKQKIWFSKVRARYLDENAK